ncbi:hypothetical protein VB773_22345 [Haloarculaceae archaeon H-GB2-1]|nr:hypothetical protein [Haloarculaceae archaeon H-GB1-1]MEA5410041.1 hypothetical protein [Haloarculaceae archaeon H-GB2-1]
MSRPILTLLVAVTMLLAGTATVSASPQIAPTDALDHHRQVDACATVENLTVSNVSLELAVANGSVEGLRIPNGTVNATVESGTVSLENATVTMETARLTDDGVVVTSSELNVSRGVLTVANVSSTTGTRPIVVESSVFRVQTGSTNGAGFTVSGITSVPGEPARLLSNSSFDVMRAPDVDRGISVREANANAIGVVTVAAESIELRGSGTAVTVSDAEVTNGELTAGDLEAEVSDGSVDVQEVTVLTGNLRVRSQDLDADLEDETVVLEDAQLNREQFSSFVEGAC